MHDKSSFRVDFTAIVADGAHFGTDFVLFLNENAVDIIEKRKNICVYQKKVVILHDF